MPDGEESSKAGRGTDGEGADLPSKPSTGVAAVGAGGADAVDGLACGAGGAVALADVVAGTFFPPPPP